MGALIQDLRHTARTLAKRPGYTAAIVVTLAFGIGVNAAIFSIIDMLVLRPLPFKDPDRLVVVSGTSRGEVVFGGVLSYPELEDLQAQARSFEDLVGVVGTSFTLSNENGLERIRGACVSARFFAMLGVEAAKGRLFRSDEDLAGAEPVAIVSDGFARDRFGGDPAIVGRTLMLDGAGFTIVGVLPADFASPIGMRRAEVWTTTSRDAAAFRGRGQHRTTVVGRLRPDVTITEAGAEMRTIGGRFARQYPAVGPDRSMRLCPLAEHIAAKARAGLYLLLGVVGLILLIACANVANLILARSEARKVEFAIRSAMGAGRRNLVRHVLLEALMLASAGAGLGLLVANWALDGLATASADAALAMRGVDLDWPVLVFTLVVTLVTSLLVCVVPAIATSRINVHTELKEGARAHAGGGRRRLLSGIQVAQVAVVFVLLVSAGLLLRSFHRLKTVDPGFEYRNLLTFQLSVPRSSVTDPGGRARLYRQVIDRLEGLPGVQSVGACTSLPLHPAGVSDNFSIVGQEDLEWPNVRFDSISPDYFQTLGVPLLRGRWFSRQDTVGHSPVLIVNETLAELFWPGRSPVGDRVALASPLNDGKRGVFEIVGVVGDMKDTTLDLPSKPCMYVPSDQLALWFMFFTIRTSVDPKGLIGSVREEVAAVTRDEAPFEFISAEELLGRTLEQRFAIVLLLSLFAAVGMGLSAVGLYGVISFSVVRRTHEIGVRMAVGGQRGHVTRMVLKQGLVLTCIGLGIGLLVSLGVTHALAGMLYETSSVDPATFLAVAVLVLCVAVSACYLPARRAAKVDPMVALRCE